MLTHRSHIVPLSPALLVAAANAFIGVSERDVHVCVTVEGKWAEMVRSAVAA